MKTPGDGYGREFAADGSGIGTMPTVAVIQTSEAVSDPDARWQAYRMSAELLVGFRRILLRCLERLHGEGWLETACPPAVRSGVARQRESELDVERFGSEGDEPIHYTTFGDLAELVSVDESLRDMLGGLSSSPDGLDSNLRSLEDIRRKIAAARMLSDAEFVVLSEMHLRLKEKLAGARRRARTARSDLDTIDTVPGEAAADGRMDESEVSPDAEPAGVSGVDSSIPEGTSRGVPAARSDEHGPAGELQGPREAARARAREVFDGASTPVGLVHVHDDDLAVLRDLRLEIVGAAEAAYSYSDGIDTSVWSRILESGWFTERVEDYGLGDVSTFYAVVESYRERHRRGDNRESLRTFLADRELAKLLLRLRELFVRLRV